MKVNINEYGETEITIDRGITAVDIHQRESSETTVVMTLSAKKTKELINSLRSATSPKFNRQGKKSIDWCPE